MAVKHKTFLFANEFKHIMQILSIRFLLFFVRTWQILLQTLWMKARFCFLPHIR